MSQRYDTIGVGYTNRRRPDPRIAVQILEAVGNASTVVNVGAGTGSYEPTGRRVVAVEPSSVMLEQRSLGVAPVVRAVAEALPFDDAVFDTAMAIFTVHHWRDHAAGLRELCRVAERQVILTWESSADFAQEFWLTRDYVPAALSVLQPETALAEVVAVLTAARREPVIRIEPVLVPHDCVDGFFGAYWRRPEAYLDAEVRASISGLALLSDGDVLPGIRRLADDLASGDWHRRNAPLLELDEIDLGYRLVIAG